MSKPKPSWPKAPLRMKSLDRRQLASVAGGKRWVDKRT